MNAGGVRELLSTLTPRSLESLAALSLMERDFGLLLRVYPFPAKDRGKSPSLALGHHVVALQEGDNICIGLIARQPDIFAEGFQHMGVVT